MDEDGKVRRNLVVFCAAVVAVAWFDIPIHQVASKALGVAGVSSVKTWSAAGIVLIYLLLRYRFSTEAQALRSQANAHIGREQWSRISPFLLSEVEEAFRTGQSSRTVGRELQEFHSGMKTKLAEASVPLGTIDSIQVHVSLDRGNSVWTGTAGINVGGGLGHYNVRYEVPRAKRWSIQAAVFLRSWVYSDVGINLVFPYVFALPATLIVGWKLLAALKGLIT